MATLKPGGDGTMTTTATNGRDAEGPDRQLAQVVYQSLKSDQKLSDPACHVVVSSMNNTVTLNGSVPSQEIKQAIGAKANEVASNRGASVVNHLSVDPNQK
jgi:osmotically-inducible protein OsmY